MERNCTLMAGRQLAEALRLLREKPETSSLIERTFLLDEAYRKYKDLPQPLIQGKGLLYTVRRCCLPVSPDDLLLGRYDDHVPTKKEEARFSEILSSGRLYANEITMRNGGHFTMDFESACDLGIPDMLRMALQNVRRAKSEPERIHARGMVLCYQAVLTYIRRYRDASAALGRTELCDVCDTLLLRAPGTFREALQLCVFIFTVAMIYAGARVCCLNFGRMDRFLLRYYRQDLRNGVLTRAKARALLTDFYCKCSLHLGRGEHQMGNPALGGHFTGWDRNPVFDSPTYITLGGRQYGKASAGNALTHLMLDCLHPGLKNPVIVFRYTKRLSEGTKTLLFEKMAQGASILLYNDEVLLPAYLNLPIDRKTAYDYSIHPCNWADLGTRGVIVGWVGGIIPHRILDVLKEAKDCPDMDTLYRLFADNFRESLRKPFADYRAYWREHTPGPNGILAFQDCFAADCLRTNRGMSDGGAPYPAYYALLRNIGTAADMMASIEQLVYTDRICTLEELLSACESNFGSRPDLLRAARRAPKYGRDDDRADRHAVRLCTLMLDILDEMSRNEKGEQDVLTLNVTINDMNHIPNGYDTGATPDGRLKGEPLSENLSPSQGCSGETTALLNSVSKLPFTRMHSGALNLRLRPDMLKDADGHSLLRVLLETYFAKGGMQVQLSIADTATLRDAQVCPECYKDLTVRITGYSAIFVDMSRNAQDEL
ncbi:MAG: hypothetical protein IKS35_06920, partial [Clostridia bacterium]|nr:hypothetical protein [Clostridia bacterium]